MVHFISNKIKSLLEIYLKVFLMDKDHFTTKMEQLLQQFGKMESLLRFYEFK